MIKKYNNFINENFKLAPYNHSMDIKGFYIYASGADRDNNLTGYLSAAGHRSFAGVHSDPISATKFESEERAKEFVDELGQELIDVKFIPANEIFTSIFKVNIHKTYGGGGSPDVPFGVSDEESHPTYGTFFIEAKPIMISKLKSSVEISQSAITRGNSMEFTEALFNTFDDAKQYIINKLDAKINKLQKNLETIKDLDLMDIDRSEGWFTSFDEK
jgi:hypothetical protein